MLLACRVDSETKDEWLDDLRETPEFVLVSARVQRAHLTTMGKRAGKPTPQQQQMLTA